MTRGQRLIWRHPVTGEEKVVEYSCTGFDGKRLVRTFDWPPLYQWVCKEDLKEVEDGNIAGLALATE